LIFHWIPSLDPRGYPALFPHRGFLYGMRHRKNRAMNQSAGSMHLVCGTLTL
jgi:hypothetical protein